MAEIVAPDTCGIKKAVSTLSAGGVVLFPTETVYGIGASLERCAAIEKLFIIKKRDFRSPLLLHCATFEQAHPFIENLPPAAEILARRFLPGPLALILYRSNAVPEIATGGGKTVGIRVVDNRTFAAIALRLGCPVVGTSANLHRKPPTNRFSEISSELLRQVDLAIDAGNAGSGIPSTVLDLTVHPPRILRAGEITRELIARTVGVEIQ